MNYNLKYYLKYNKQNIGFKKINKLLNTKII